MPDTPGRRKLSDLQEHLYAQLDRLGESDIDGEKLDAEIRRTHAMTEIAGRVVEVRRVALDTWKVAASLGQVPTLSMLTTGDAPGEE